MKNIVIGVLLASLLVACASDELPAGDLKKRGRPADAPLSAAAGSAPGASVAVDTLNDQNSVSQTSKSASTSAEQTAAKAAAEEAAAKAVAEEAALAASRAAEVQNAALEAAKAAAAKAAAEEAALAAVHAAEIQNAELEAAKAAAAQAAADAAAAREAASAAAARETANTAKVAAELEAANVAAAREAANAAKIAVELEAAKASAAQAAADAAAAREAANAAAAQNAAKANAARDAAKAAAAREAVAEDSSVVPSGLLAKRSVYYLKDVDAVQEQDKRTVQAYAKYLAEHPNRSVRLEGHADERGSSEYNLALGQRRAEGVKKMLLVGGVKDGQIESVSYGEEKPMSTAHDETAWSQNRRTDLIYNVK